MGNIGERYLISKFGGQKCNSETSWKTLYNKMLKAKVLIQGYIKANLPFFTSVKYQVFLSHSLCLLRLYFRYIRLVRRKIFSLLGFTHRFFCWLCYSKFVNIVEGFSLERGMLCRISANFYSYCSTPQEGQKSLRAS